MNPLDMLVAEERRNEMLRQAERDRLMRRARAARRATPVYYPALSWVGRRMVRTGLRLLIISREWERGAGAPGDSPPAPDVNLMWEG